eukprot:353341-Rhodomonas_salina.1
MKNTHTNLVSRIPLCVVLRSAHGFNIETQWNSWYEHTRVQTGKCVADYSSRYWQGSYAVVVPRVAPPPPADYPPTRSELLCHVQYWLLCLSGTDSYTVPGTDRDVMPGTACYAMSGTDTGYAATRYYFNLPAAPPSSSSLSVFDFSGTQLAPPNQME